ncbi:hypothetical protein SAMN04490190_0121 [Pseudomonas libanensis]|nr:hypothetical protein SAMN04490190_0121 [Pseudomonas libanensis]
MGAARKIDIHGAKGGEGLRSYLGRSRLMPERATVQAGARSQQRP